MKTCPACQSTYPDDFSLCPRDGAHLTAQATETEAQLAAGLSHRFRLVRRLGQGGMGTVFLAEQIGVGNRPVALKVLNRKLLDDPDFLLRFQNEAGSTGRIHHPNVVTIHESAQSDDGTPYIAMEFLEGESLHEVLKRRGALPVAEVAEILQQAARGLNAAHKLGIIHRDLKPDNIFLTYPDDAAAPLAGAHDALAFPHDVGAGLVPALPVGIADAGRAQDPPLRPVVVKVVDFGIAKLRESGAHTQTGTVLGTPAYMSFEQASGMRSDELDARSDIYSLGVVVYEMLTGRTPFHSDTPVGYLRMHMQEDPPPLRTVKPDLPALPQLESVVMKALTKDRNQRYGSVLEFAREFAVAAPSPFRVVDKTTVIETRIHVAPASNSAPTSTPAHGVKPIEKVSAPIQPARMVPKVLPTREGLLTTVILSVGQAAAIVYCLWFTVSRGPKDYGKYFVIFCFLLSFAPLAFFLWAGMRRFNATGSIAIGLVHRWKKLTLGTLALICLVGLLSWVPCLLVPTAPWHLGGIETGYGLFGVAVLSSTFVVLWRLGHHKTACGLLALSIIIPALFLSFLLLHSFKLDHTLTGHLDLVNSVAFSPDGKSLASGSSDGTIKLWDVAHGTLSQTLTGHSGSVFSVAFSPDGKSLASGCSDGIELWGLATGTLTQRLTGHLENVGLPALSVAFSPDGQLLAAGEFGGVELVDVATGTVRRTLPVPSAKWVESVAFSPDGKSLASAGFEGPIELWDVANGTLSQTSNRPSESVSSIAFSPDGRLLALGGFDAIELWDVATGKVRKTLTSIYPRFFPVNSVAFSPDGMLLASGMNNGMIELWDVATGKLRKAQGVHRSEVSCVAFSPDGKLLASASGDKTVKLWRVAQ